MSEPMIIHGTWDEIAVRANELRGYGELVLIVPQPRREQPRLDQQAVDSAIEAILAEVDQQDLRPGPVSSHPDEAAVDGLIAEKYRRQGLVL